MAHPVGPLGSSSPDSQHAPADDSGRFAIDSKQLGTMLPPADGPAEILSLEELGGALIESAPRTAPPPPPPARPAVSGVFRSGEDDPERAFAERIISLSPIYNPRETAQGERAVLDIEDLSLRPDNPYLASSLVPPSKPKQARGGLLAAGAVALSMLGAGAWYFTHAPSPAAPPTSRSLSTRAVARAVPASVSTHEAPAPIPQQRAAESPTSVPAAAIVADAPAAPDKPAAVTEPLRPTTPAPTKAAAADHTAKPEPSGAPAVEAAPPSPAAAAPAVAAETTPLPGDEALPALPTREQVAAGFDAVRAQLEQCAGGQHGVANVAATVAGSGRVSYALVQGPFAGTPEGSCMALAVRQAHFPRFSQPSLKVVYPFSL